MLEASIRWIKTHSLPERGVAVTSARDACYPEVTGYLIPTLLSIGERQLAIQYAEWLTRVQRDDGSFGAEDGGPAFAFDTGQVIRGWVAILPLLPLVETPLGRACDWLAAVADPGTGRLPVPRPGADWSLGPRGEVNEAIHLYALAPLRAAGEALGEARYTRLAERARDYYCRTTDCADFRRPNALTHFYAYVQEALLDLGCEDEARRGMAAVAAHQQQNGAVPGYHDVPWVCSTGLAQLAQVWYRLGESVRADAAMRFLAGLQNPSGGFFGSYGVGATYFPAEEISWAAKYALEAGQREIAAHFDATAGQYRSDVAEDDGRAQALLRHVGDLAGRRVLDAGCGKGRYAALVQRRFPTAEIVALDVSAEMLRHVPRGIRTVEHSILSMPFPDGAFDAVYCIEALEHVSHVDQGIRELARVLAPGGTLVVIDKNRERLGALDMPAWERWFGVDELRRELAAHGVAAEAELVGYDEVKTPDGLFVCWAGRKRAGARAA